MTDHLVFYRQKLSKLRIDRSKGPAPHKPLLFLSLMELIESGKIKENRFPPSPLLTATFLKYWSKLVLEDRTPNIALPFFHLSRDGFWHLEPNRGYEKALDHAKNVRSFSELKTIVNYGSLDEGLFGLLNRKDSRDALRETIMTSYFAERSGLIFEILEDNKKVENSERELKAEAGLKFKLIREPEPVYSFRNRAFRNMIMSLYNYTCSICKAQLITLNGESIVDAAHIVPFSKSNNDDIRNGVSLCKNHHWCFDRGLVGVDEDYRVIVSSLVVEENVLGNLSGERIMLPRKAKLMPARAAFEWHRRKMFQK